MIAECPAYIVNPRAIVARLNHQPQGLTPRLFLADNIATTASGILHDVAGKFRYCCSQSINLILSKSQSTGLRLNTDDRNADV